MGSYSTFKIGEFEIGWDKNSFDPYLLSLFHPDEKVVYDTTIGESEYFSDYEDDEASLPVTIVQYVSSSRIVKDRLDVQGYTVFAAIAGFKYGLESEKEVLREHALDDDRYGTYTEQLSQLDLLNLDSWKEAIGVIHQTGVARFDLTNSDMTPMVRYCLKHPWYGFPGDERRHFLRLLLEYLSDEESLVYDFTDLVMNDMADSAYDFMEELNELVSAKYSAERRSVILTEGSTDAKILKRSLDLLYPHLSDSFHFLDFEGAKVGGGAGTLCSIVKAFTGAGLINRFIVIFDNDTAARSAVKSLKSIKLPENIVVQHYPFLSLAKQYPTIGPTGLTCMDVNGLAGSVELYLGEDCLTDDNGKFIPVQWRGYDSSMGEYQGQILHKSAVLKCFEEKLKICEADTSKIADFDWSGVRSILQTIFAAYQQQKVEEN